MLVTVSVPHGAPEKTTLNLTGPILVNYESRVGLQVPQVDTKYPSHYYIHQPNAPSEGIPRTHGSGKVAKGESAGEALQGDSQGDPQGGPEDGGPEGDDQE